MTYTRKFCFVLFFFAVCYWKKKLFSRFIFYIFRTSIIFSLYAAIINVWIYCFVVNCFQFNIFHYCILFVFFIFLWFANKILYGFLFFFSVLFFIFFFLSFFFFLNDWMKLTLALLWSDILLTLSVIINSN